MKRILVLTGFVALLGQIVLLRELNVAFFGIELIYTVALGIWLLGTAAGAAVSRKRFIPSYNNIYALLVLSSLLLPSSIIYIRAIRMFSGEARGAFLPLSYQFFSIFISLFPLSFLMGAAFQWSAKLFVLSKRTLAKAYSIESVGGLCGGLISTLLVWINLSNLQIGLACSILLVFVVDRFFPHFKNKIIFAVQLFFLMIYTILLVKSNKIDEYTASWNHPNIIESKDTPYCRVSISYYLGQYSVFEDDALIFESESTDAEEFCNIPLLMHSNPGRILLIGGGYSGALNEILKLNYNNVTYVEYNKRLDEILKPILAKSESNNFNAGVIKTIYDEPRNFLKNNNFYDVILLNMPEPSSGQTNRFFTKEFFQLCSGRLNSNGIIAFRLPSAENLWSPLLTKRNASIYKTLKTAFKDIVVLPGTSNIYIASNQKVENNPDILSERFTKRNISARLVSPNYIRYLLKNNRLPYIHKLMEEENVPYNIDNKPVCYQFTEEIWLSKFFPQFNDFSFYDQHASTYLYLLIFIILLFAALRFFKKLKKYSLIFFISLIGIILELILILRYQTINGILFQNIGLLLMSFMAGLSAGSFLIDKIFLTFVITKKGYVKIGWNLILLFAVLSWSIGFLLNTACLTGIWGISLMLILTGCMISAIFSYLSFANSKDSTAIISPLYASDILGGFLGALLAGLLLIPLIGLSNLAFSAALLSLLLLILL